ncbi:hypothetical protein [Streptomyces sp. BF23-19]|uniref:hypothetical protein n=1 Tax=unclassified Streptomyces TaxID=2593676 RepID=UPI0034E5B1F7
MTTHSSAVTLKHAYYRCRLGRRQLDALFVTASAGFGESGIEYSTERNSRTFRAPTLIDLVDAVRSAPLPGDPDKWDNLAFVAKDSSGKCAVTLQLDQEQVEVSIIGSDPTWVYGADAQIRIFLEDGAVGGGSARRSDARRKSQSAALGALFWVFWLLYAVAWYPGSKVGAPPGATGDEWVNKPLPTSSLAVLAAIGLYFALKALQFWARDRAGAGRLAVTGEVPDGRWWKTLTTTEQLTAIGVLVAILAALGTLISAGADVFKNG